MNDGYVLGIDIGSQVLRAGLFDPKGNIISVSSVSYPIHQPHFGWAEQDVKAIWKAFKKAIGSCLHLASDGNIRHQVKAISIDGTAVSLVTADKNGVILGPSIMWMDTRATKEANLLSNANSEWLKYTGGKLSPEWMLPKALWIKYNRPELFKNSKRIVELTDWLDFKLTGIWSASLTTLSAEWSYCSHLGGWPHPLLKEYNLEDLLDKIPTLILSPGEIIGTLSPPVARELDLPPDILVAKGLMDSYAAALGLNIFRGNSMAVSIGTSSAYISLSKKPLFHKGLLGPVPDAFGYGNWAIQGGQTSAGAIIKWFMDNIGRHSTYNNMDENATQIPPGSEGLISLECWQGSRTPFRDPKARGAIWGLNIKHSIYHIYRALLEGIAFGGRQVLDTMSEIGIKPNDISVCGGGTRSKLLMQIHADVLGIPLIISSNPEMAILGAGICASVAAGFYSTIEIAAKEMSGKGELIEPNVKNHGIYQAFYKEYLIGYPALSSSFSNLAKLREEQFS